MFLLSVQRVSLTFRELSGQHRKRLLRYCPGQKPSTAPFCWSRRLPIFCAHRIVAAAQHTGRKSASSLLGYEPSLSPELWMESIVNALKVYDWHLWWVAVLSVLVFSVVLLALWRFAVRTRRSSIYYNPTDLNGALLLHCTTMRQYDRVPLWGFNGHVQSIYASQVRKGPTYPLRRYVILCYSSVSDVQSCILTV